MNVLVIIDGILAKYFLERLCLENGLEYFFTILYYDDNSINDFAKQKNMNFIKFDPTSLGKMEDLFKINNFFKAFIFMQDEFDTKRTYENIRYINDDIDIVIMDFWGLSIAHKHLELINAKLSLANQMMNHLPNIAKTAQFIGLGIGEIMEVKIPAGSIFAYRSLGSIEQIKWHIVLIYRNSKILLAHRKITILPNDTLILVGHPNVLQTIHNTIQNQNGQFPNPFGTNTLLILDMKDNIANLTKALNTALIIQKKSTSKMLLIYVINPIINEFYEKIKIFEKENIKIIIEYKNINIKNSFASLSDDYNIGLIILNEYMFEKYKKSLFEIKIPILKIGIKDFEHIKKAIVLSSNEIELESLANVMIDLGKQLNLDIKISHYSETNEKKLEEYFKTLSKLYDKAIKISNEKNKNPLLIYANRSDMLQFIRFDKNICNPYWMKVLNTNINSLYDKMNKNYQIFIPVS